MGGIDLATVNIDPSQGSFAVANNLRIASLSIAAYEYVACCVSLTLHSDLLAASYLLTLPSEIRLYKTTKRRR
jgi:hypothetical protein